MFFTSRKQYSIKNAKQIFINENSKLPQLYRLCNDFGFAVIALNEETATPKKYTLCEVGLVKDSLQKADRVTPEFRSLSELEAHVNANVIDIVQKYLFGDDDLSDESSASVA